jgi:hypothetical protein
MLTVNSRRVAWFLPSVAAFSGGDFVVVWTSVGQDGSLDGVYGQRFQVIGVAPAAR